MQTQRPTAFKASVVLTLVLLLGWLGFLAAGQGWHASWHHDAGSAEHHCAITMLAQGKLSADLQPAMVVCFVATLLIGFRQVATPVSRTIRFLLLPGRAPPVLP
ncbi:MAG TPA: hypothetical protein VK968_01465 [Roseimicrobium sp.]|nr:hypothetical protein [Roseimicrobium sp.]